MSSQKTSMPMSKRRWNCSRGNILLLVSLSFLLFLPFLVLAGEFSRGWVKGKRDRERREEERRGNGADKKVDYALQFAIPNFYFHFVTAYDILRAQGVPVGKRHYLGRA